MLANYLTTAFRHLWRERGYAAINLFGLAVGLALCLLVIQLAAYQLSVGDFHEKKDRLYRILKQTGPPKGPSSPLPLGPALKEQIPEVEETVRFTGGSPRLLRVGRQAWDSCEGSLGGSPAFSKHSVCPSCAATRRPLCRARTPWC